MTMPENTVPPLVPIVPDPGLERWMLEVLAAPGPTGPGGVFYVDPDRAQACINLLEEAALDLDAAAKIRRTGTFPPPGQDPVSVNVAEQAAIMAQRAEAFVLAWQRQIRETAQALRVQLAAYQDADTDALRRT